jgi:hypothetical protein
MRPDLDPVDAPTSASGTQPLSTVVGAEVVAGHDRGAISRAPPRAGA